LRLRFVRAVQSEMDFWQYVFSKRQAMQANEHIGFDF
jgi:hypothetical protein